MGVGVGGDSLYLLVFMAVPDPVRTGPAAQLGVPCFHEEGIDVGRLVSISSRWPAARRLTSALTAAPSSPRGRGAVSASPVLGSSQLIAFPGARTSAESPLGGSSSFVSPLGPPDRPRSRSKTARL